MKILENHEDRAGHASGGRTATTARVSFQRLWLIVCIFLIYDFSAAAIGWRDIAQLKINLLGDISAAFLILTAWVWGKVERWLS